MLVTTLNKEFQARNIAYIAIASNSSSAYQ